MIAFKGMTMYEFQLGRLNIKILRLKFINRRNLKIIRIQIVDKGENHGREKRMDLVT